MCFSKLRTLNRSSSCKLFPFHHAFKFQVLRFSELSNISPNLKKPQENPFIDPAKTKSIISLFKEISKILGSDSFTIRKTSSGNSVFGDTHERSRVVSEHSMSSTQGVCGNSKDKAEAEMGGLLTLEETQLGNVGGGEGETADSSIVKTACIVGDSANSMEERLENSGIMFDSDIVEKVLNRCLKLPHLALRFFNWVRLRDGFCHTTGIYNTMIHIAGRARECGLVEELLGEMEKHSCQRDGETWTKLISHYGMKSTGKALLTFEMMKKSGFEPDVTAYEAMIGSLCAAEKTEIAMEMYKEMVHKGINPSTTVYTNILHCLATSGDSASVHLVIDDMRRVSRIPERTAYGWVLKSFCKSGRIKETLELICDMISKNVTFDVEYMKNLVKCLCRADKFAYALEIVDIMKRKHIIDGEVYGTVISAYLKRKDTSTALDFFHTTIEFGHLPPSSTYTELILHFFRLNEYWKGCELYDDMLARGIQPEGVAIKALFAGHVYHSRISEAWKVFKFMEETSIKIPGKSCSFFIKKLCKMSRTDEIIRVLKKVQASQVGIGEVVFNWVVSYFEKRGDMENTETVKQIKRNCKVYPHRYEEVFLGDVYKEWEHNLSSKAYETGTRQVDTDISKPLPKGYSYQDLEEICRILSSPLEWLLVEEALKKCCVQFNPALVEAVLHHSIVHSRAPLNFFSWVGKQAGYCHTTETYNLAIKISGSMKDFTLMKTLFYEMRRNRDLATSDTWTIMIRQYGKTGMSSVALRIFREMKAGGFKPNSNTYKFLILCLCKWKGRNVDEAIEKFDEMIHAGHTPDKHLIETYINCLCEADRLLHARRCAEYVCGLGFSIPLSYSLYIRGLFRAGRYKEASSLMDEIDSDRSMLDPCVYATMVHGLLKLGRLEKALAKMDAMTRVGIYPNAPVYTSLIYYFFKHKQVQRAMEVFKRMREEGCEPTIVTYSTLIQGYVNNKKAAEAWDVFNRIKLEGPHPDFKTYSSFIECLCKARKSEEALQLLSEMMDNGIPPGYLNFRIVIHALDKEGKHDSARIVSQKKKALELQQKLAY